MAWAHLVDVVLKDTRVDHRSTDDHEASRNALDRTEVDAFPAKEGVNHIVEDGDEDDDRDGVQVLDQIVGSAVKRHSSSHSTVVAVNLGVAEPENRKPHEDLTCRDCTSHFPDELIVPGEVLWASLSRVGRWSEVVSTAPISKACKIHVQGFAASQKSSARKVLQSLTRLRVHLPRAAILITRPTSSRIEPRGGVVT